MWVLANEVGLAKLDANGKVVLDLSKVRGYFCVCFSYFFDVNTRLERWCWTSARCVPGVAAVFFICSAATQLADTGACAWGAKGVAGGLEEHWLGSSGNAACRSWAGDRRLAFHARFTLSACMQAEAWLQANTAIQLRIIEAEVGGRAGQTGQ